jgi:hypothetical protein
MPSEELDSRLPEPRSSEQALVELRATYQRRPSADLARTIQQLDAKIARRKEPEK